MYCQAQWFRFGSNICPNSVRISFLKSQACSTDVHCFHLYAFPYIKCSFAGTVLRSVSDMLGKINTDLLIVGLVRAFRTLPSPGDLQMGCQIYLIPETFQ